ncbi:MAG TPA: 4a-hydroxytetrahydrobiopterin dehydratase [Nevskiaceae bacterium]|nr:4a-hydroxytetrahydrobiopterin dehydratase [Nevskiaceae bacterium]
MPQTPAHHCVPCEGGVPALTPAQAQQRMSSLAARWALVEDNHALAADFEFNNYFRTLAFVNAVAYVAINEDHHPDISFGYRSAHIRYATHAVGGLSDNDFICAAKIDDLLN